jgi:hypothetical protein
MVRRRTCAVSNHERNTPSFETPRKSAAPQDEVLVLNDISASSGLTHSNSGN